MSFHTAPVPPSDNPRMPFWQSVALIVCTAVLCWSLCGCDLRVTWHSEPESAETTVDEARNEVERLIEANKPPAPEPDPIGAQPPESKPKTAPDPPKREPAEPIPPTGWPRDVVLQKFTGPGCVPCLRWDAEQAAELEAVMLPPIIAADQRNVLNAAGRAAGITTLPTFHLIRESTGEVLWIGRGYWQASDLIRKAQEYGS